MNQTSIFVVLWKILSPNQYVLYANIQHRITHNRSKYLFNADNSKSIKLS